MPIGLVSMRNIAVCGLLFAAGLAGVTQLPAADEIVPAGSAAKQTDASAASGVIKLAATGIADRYSADMKETQKVGSNGILLIRSQERLDQLHGLCPRLFPTPADIRPGYMNIPASDPLPKVDFTKQSLVLCYSGLRPNDRLFVQDENLGVVPPHVSYMLQWDDVQNFHGLEADFVHYAYKIIPATSAVEISWESEPAHPKGVPNTEFAGVIGGKHGGDVVDGLQGQISTPVQTIAPGIDILIAFELHMPQPPEAHWDKLVPHTNANRVVVIDEDPEFFVTTPDGKTALRSKAIRRREQGIAPVSNPVHPSVTITANKPHFLSRSDQTPISLHDLGVSTAAPGTYTITGVFADLGDGERELRYENKLHWGGSIATNSITVTVK